ncbi:MAG: 1,2-phenylacetyl-CoA epoxidase subunit PaaD [Balneolaceae bacterium]|nr:1,2-phenylacetyl-CoA epoxidase subunit PaaD [Balneolaceae bacterium]
MSATTATYSREQIWDFLREVHDPEIPVLNIVEMGIARGVEIKDGHVTIRITPTYSGCPAMVAIEQEVQKKLAGEGLDDFEVVKDFKETWTTDWMTEEAQRKLKEYGIAPPGKTSPDDDFLESLKNSKVVPCPYCDSLETELQSEFGSTACKAQYYCRDCDEPFEHFKCI